MSPVTHRHVVCVSGAAIAPQIRSRVMDPNIIMCKLPGPGSQGERGVDISLANPNRGENPS